jgi:hypothetical protein
MIHNVVEEYGRVLENAFFAHQDEVLLARLRETARNMERRQALSAACGITDEAVLQHFVDLGLTPRTVAALSLVPTLLVAWADGLLDAKEAAAVRDAARTGALAGNQDALALLESWLSKPPARAVEKAWHEYVRALAPGMSPEARATLKAETIGRARHVAEAAGGFLGLGIGNRISESEHRVLAELEAAFGD